MSFDNLIGDYTERDSVIYSGLEDERIDFMTNYYKYDDAPWYNHISPKEKEKKVNGGLTNKEVGNRKKLIKKNLKKYK
jgi:hypothetical protein